MSIFTPHFVDLNPTETTYVRRTYYLVDERDKRVMFARTRFQPITFSEFSSWKVIEKTLKQLPPNSEKFFRDLFSVGGVIKITITDDYSFTIEITHQSSWEAIDGIIKIYANRHFSYPETL